MYDNAVLAALRRLRVPKERSRGTDAGPMARTILGEVLGFRPELIEHQLADAVETYAVHTYSPDHIYRLYVTGDGKPLSFYISDLDYAGNFGALTVRITPVKKNKN